MDQGGPVPISVVALRAEDYTPDGKNVIISLTTKFSAVERKFSVPIECFHDLVVDLQRLNGSADDKTIETAIQTTVAPNPDEDLHVSLATWPRVRTGTE